MIMKHDNTILMNSVKSNAKRRESFIAIQPYLKKQEKHQINLTLHPKQLEKKKEKYKN